jgi:hypothetical protein
VRPRKFKKSRRTANSSVRHWMTQDTQLGEQRDLIPMDVLVSHFAGLKLDDADQDEFDFSTRGGQIRKHPIHIESVGEADHELFDDPVVAEGL